MLIITGERDQISCRIKGGEEDCVTICSNISICSHLLLFDLNRGFGAIVLNNSQYIQRRGGGGAGDPDPPEKSQKYRVS